METDQLEIINEAGSARRVSSTTIIRIIQLRALLAQLKPEDAYALARPMVEFMKNSKDQLSLWNIIFAELVSRMNQEQARGIAEAFYEATKGVKDADQLEALGPGLKSVAPQLKPEDARMFGR
jgi:hypothetical protein